MSATSTRAVQGHGAPAEEDDEVDGDLRDIHTLLVLRGGRGDTARHLEGILEGLAAGEQRDRREERCVGRHALVHVVARVRDGAVESVHVLAAMAALFGLANDRRRLARRTKGRSTDRMKGAAGPK